MQDRPTSGPPRALHSVPPALSEDRLRVGIDRGDAGDRVPFPDPATAPPGTDDEAEGPPTAPVQRQMAGGHDLRRAPPADPAEPPIPPFGLRLSVVVLAVVVLLLAVLLVFSRPM
jgi:hypothetical protein